MEERPVPDENMMPLGMAMSLAMNTDAMHAFSLLTPEEQDGVMERARGVASKPEMEDLVNGIARHNEFY